MVPTIREATQADLPELARLRWDFRREHGDVAPGISFEGFGERFEPFARAALEDGRWWVLVAEREGRLVGTVWFQLVPKVPAPSSRGEYIGYLTNAYVEAEDRNRGVGAALVERALDFARDAAVEQVITWPTERSVPFYERAGFSRSAHVWERYLIRDPYGRWRPDRVPTGE
jgi:GNAT superfamily N-acetyltransferase